MSDSKTPLNSKNYVKWFRNSAPYINAHRGKTFVLMFGGEAVAHDNFATIIHDIALLNSLGVRLVLVHGARPQIEERVALRGIDSQFEHDLRITCPQTLESVKDATGSLRSQIEALLTMGLANSPMHGSQIRVCSGNMVIAKPIGVRGGIDYQHTGVVRRIDSQAIQSHLQDNAIVLLSPIGYSPTGEVFNLSLENVATQTAIALQADKLIAFSDKPGLLNPDGSLINNTDISTVKQLLDDSSDLQEQVLMRALINSAEKGVERCHCISYQEDGALLAELFTRDGSGTLIAQDTYDQMRTACIDDVGGILELIEPLEANGTLVKRSRELLENEIDHFTVLEKDGMIIACAALYPYPQEKLGEVACVATHPDYRGGERGLRVLHALQKQAAALGLLQLFVLTTVTAHWFQEQGFIEGNLSLLPAKRQSLYNYQRNSKIFAKAITG
ncbi:amino-acid N-acetyltransferase [Dasania marina]|uniref:amino-acid N-acetyltransferase n=1 Tax=Dasania marina TaxID=471499 RepID=UPI00037187FD|nr:amino-acid N-acetyltransferase [Dasania marina]